MERLVIAQEKIVTPGTLNVSPIRLSIDFWNRNPENLIDLFLQLVISIHVNNLSTRGTQETL